MDMPELKITNRIKEWVEKSIKTLMDDIPILLTPSEPNPGQKAFFCLPIKNEPINVTDNFYVFVENTLPYTPKNEKFDDDDIINNCGIHIFVKNHIGIPIGYTYSINTLLEMITDTEIKKSLIKRIKEMKKIVELPDGFIDHVNHVLDDGEKNLIQRLH